MSQAPGNPIFSTDSKLFPFKFALKYEPPLIGMFYHVNEKEKKNRLYKIYLHGLIYQNDADFITNQLFKEHPLHLSEKWIAKKQIKELVVKLLASWNKKTDQKESTVDLLNMDFPANTFSGKSGIKDSHSGSKKKYQYEYDEPNDLDRNIDDLDPKDLEFDEQGWDQFDDDVEHQQGKGNQEKGGSNSRMNFLKNMQGKGQN